MGHGQSVSNSSSRNVSVASESGLSLSGRQKFGREHKRHGVVTLKMVSTNPTGRRGNEQIISHTITPKGCILYPAGMYAPATVQHGKCSVASTGRVNNINTFYFIYFHSNCYIRVSNPSSHRHPSG